MSHCDNPKKICEHMDLLKSKKISLEEKFELLDYLSFFKRKEVDLLLSCKTEKEFIYRSAEIIGNIRLSSDYDKINGIIKMLNKGRVLENKQVIPS